MKLIKTLDNYINDKKYKMIYTANKIDIINYTEILDFTSKLISIKYKEKIFYIEGEELVISKMMENEVLITGKINKVTFT